MRVGRSKMPKKHLTSYMNAPIPIHKCSSLAKVRTSQQSKRPRHKLPKYTQWTFSKFYLEIVGPIQYLFCNIPKTPKYWKSMTIFEYILINLLLFEKVYKMTIFRIIFNVAHCGICRQTIADSGKHLQMLLSGAWKNVLGNIPNFSYFFLAN